MDMRLKLNISPNVNTDTVNGYIVGFTEKAGEIGYKFRIEPDTIDIVDLETRVQQLKGDRLENYLRCLAATRGLTDYWRLTITDMPFFDHKGHEAVLGINVRDKYTRGKQWSGEVICSSYGLDTSNGFYLARIVGNHEAKHIHLVEHCKDSECYFFGSGDMRLDEKIRHVERLAKISKEKRSLASCGYH